MSYVKPVTAEQVRALRELSGEGLMKCKSVLEKRAMLAAIEEVRWELSPTEQSTAVHTILDVLEYLVKRA